MKKMMHGLVWFLIYVFIQMVCFILVKPNQEWIPIYSYIILSVISFVFGAFNANKLYPSVIWYSFFVLVIPIYSAITNKHGAPFSSNTAEIIIVFAKISVIIISFTGLGFLVKKFIKKQKGVNC